MKRALVIGGTGFIGLHVVHELIARGISVRVTRRPKTPTILLQGCPVEFVDASLEEPENLRRAMRDCDVAFLTGAYYPRYSLDLKGSLEQGIRGVRNACEAACGARVKRLIYTSTIATLARAPSGRMARESDRELSMPTNSVYRTVKWAMEREVEAAHSRGLHAVTLLPGGCIGPWDVRLGTGSIFAGTVLGLLPWWVDGQMNLIDVSDVARAHVEAALHPAASDRYCLAGHNLSVGWLLRHIARRYGGRVPKLRLSPEEAQIRAEADEREAAPHRRRVPIPREFVDMAITGQPVSSRRAHKELGLALTPLDEALDRAHDWFVRFHFLPRIPSRDERRPHETSHD